MFNKKLKDRVEELEKMISSLGERVYELECPARFKIGDHVCYDIRDKGGNTIGVEDGVIINVHKLKDGLYYYFLDRRYDVLVGDTVKNKGENDLNNFS